MQYTRVPCWHVTYTRGSGNLRQRRKRSVREDWWCVGGERRGNVVVWRSSCRENKEKKKKNIIKEATKDQKKKKVGEEGGVGAPPSVPLPQTILTRRDQQDLVGENTTRNRGNGRHGPYSVTTLPPTLISTKKNIYIILHQ